MDIYQYASALSKLNAVSGREDSGHEELGKLCGGFFDEVFTTSPNNFIGVRRCGKEGAKKIMLDAHFDEIGFIVKDICEGGFLKVVNVGGIDTGILPASEVVIHGKEDILGVFTSVPPHLKTGSSDEKPLLSALAIDTGFDKKKLEEIVTIGDTVSYKSEVMKLGENKLCGKTFDDRICMLSILEALELLSGKELNVDIYVLFAGGEETGYIGAKTGAYLIDPDIAVALDVCNAYVPGADESRKQMVLGGGGVVSFSATLDLELTEKIIEVAKKNDIPYQIVVETSHTGTDAHILQLTRAGIPGALISLPLLNMHSYNEVCSIDDVKNVALLLAEYILTL